MLGLRDEDGDANGDDDGTDDGIIGVERSGGDVDGDKHGDGDDEDDDVDVTGDDAISDGETWETAS